MAKRHKSKSPIPHDLSFGNDPEFDALPVLPLQRGTSVGPTSPRESHGTLAKIRRSFYSGKEKYKDMCHQLELDNDRLRRERDESREDLENLRQRMTLITNNSTYHVSDVTNLQVGDNNYVINNVEAIDKALEDIEELIKTLTDAVDSVIEERTKVEMELEKHKVMLCEIQETLSQFSKQCEEKGKMDSKGFKELKSLLVGLQSDRSDEQVITQCVEGLREHILVHNRMVSDFNCLPGSIKPGITRLVNKFNKMPWTELATRLGMQPSNIGDLTVETGHDSGNEKTVVTRLDKDMCAKIMAEWVRDPGHTMDMFMQHMRAIEIDRTEAAKQKFTKSVIGRKRRPKTSRQQRASVHSEQSTLSQESSSTYRERMRIYASQQLGEQRTQTAHAVELCSMVLDNVKPLKPIKTKIDLIYELVLKLDSRLPQGEGGGGMVYNV